MRRLARAAPLLLGLLLVCGCPATVEYAPRKVIRDDLGTFDARRELEEVIARAREPQIIGSLVNETSFAWAHRGYARPVHGRSGYNVRVYFRNVERMDLYDNHYVYIWGAHDQFLAKILFYTAEDATRFIDLVQSLKDMRLRPIDEVYIPGTATPPDARGEPPAPREEPRKERDPFELTPEEREGDGDY